MRAACRVDADVLPGPVPVEVLDYWAAKGLRIGFDHRDVWEAEHDLAFTAARVMRADVLVALQEELQRAFEQGLPYEQWRNIAQERFKALGWWEEHTVTDPITGRAATVNPPARLRRIFETNMRTARAAGQHDRVQRTKRSRPYLMYVTGASANHRPEHVSWHGLVLPVDDPFWSTHFPPNGWGCKCGVRTMSERDVVRAERDGILSPRPEPVLDDDGLPTGHVVDRRVPILRTAPEIKLVPWQNARTGAVEAVPEGVDPGFAHRPGDARRRALEEAEAAQ